MVPERGWQWPCLVGDVFVEEEAEVVGKIDYDRRPSKGGGCTRRESRPMPKLLASALCLRPSEEEGSWQETEDAEAWGAVQICRSRVVKRGRKGMQKNEGGPTLVMRCWDGQLT